LLIRLSPYPFNLLNVLFAATDIKLSHFAAGTALSLSKIALHVYIGANLTSFAKHVLGEDEDMTEDQLRVEKIRYIAIVFFSIVAFGVMAYLYRVAKAAVAETNNLDEEQMSFLNHHDEEVGFLDDDDESDGENMMTKNVAATAINLDAPTSSNVAVPKSNQLHMSEDRDSISLDNWDAWGDETDEEEAEQVIPLDQKLKKEGLGKSD
jgi:cbb3-type cytochrome oxidase subunit 3